MKIEVLSYDEDGFVELDLDEEGQDYLIALGFETMILQRIEELENEDTEAR